MKLLAALATQRALKRYARELPARLAHDYGASEFYTVAQIRTAAAALKLDSDRLTYGYAMFLPEEAFDALDPHVRGPLSYAQARAELARHFHSAPTDDGGFHESGIGLQAGVNVGGGHSLP
jgi:hypothetical protein